VSAGENRRMSAVERALHDPDAAPLGPSLDDGFSEEQVPRLWRGVEERALRASFARRHVVVLLAAAALLVIVSAGALRFFRPGAPLLLASGAPPSVLDAARGRVESRFADGSRIQLHAGSRMEVLRNDGQSFVSVLQRGEGVFEVEPGGSRRWVVHAGIANVEVIGTRFSVVREPGRVEVSVTRGVVMVLAESLPNGAARLVAGQSIVVRAPNALDGSASPPTKTSENARPPSTTQPEVAATASAPLAPVTAAPPRASGVRAQPADAIDELFRIADQARARGDTAAAVEAYEAVLARAPARDPRRGLAAMSLTRLTLHGNPARAASALDESMPGMPSALAEDALARQVEAEGRSGRREEAARLARIYLSRFPDGRREADVRRWLSP
jgi:transmembrane sensor